MSLIGMKLMDTSNEIYNSRNYMSLIGIFRMCIYQLIYNSRNYMSLIGWYLNGVGDMNLQ